MASGAVGLVVWGMATPTTLGWVLLVQANTPVADAVIVIRNGGSARHAVAVHATTAALLIATGSVLILR
ncbi:DUF4267 domain-containing protein [Mobilicoccus massiliensis]|uniref:DUF4267 domain-containing protein n=1 Tax=Mobilicoccus massiliensis TaxID=1522310 RepID=UPI0021C3AB6C|nr:DUF4267 domain-containing protein [Mobilicoccus massiliensis]